jgi:hypothetical protein
MPLEKGHTRRNSFFSATRGGFLRVAGVHNNLRRSGGPRECLSQIEGAIRYCFYRVSIMLWTDSKNR